MITHMRQNELSTIPYQLLALIQNHLKLKPKAWSLEKHTGVV